MAAAHLLPAAAPSFTPDPPALNRLSADVYTALSQHTAFPWPLLKTQGRRHGIDPANLTPAGLGELIQPLALGVARFNDMQSGFAARMALVELLRRVTAAKPR
jgi:hypothetical protein